MKPKYPGKLITFEGCDGCGKTEQSKLLVEYLGSKGYDTLLLREPGGDELSEHLGKLIKYKDFRQQVTGSPNLTPKAQLFLFLAARANLVDSKIKKALAEEKVVILDRYRDSTFAYQGYGCGHPLKLISILNNYATDGIRPDLTFFIDINPELGLEKSLDAKKGEFELRGPEFQSKVRLGYLKLVTLEPERIRTVPYIKDGISDMHQIIRAQAQDILTKSKDYRFYFAVNMANRKKEDPVNNTAKRIVDVLNKYGRVISEHFVHDDAFEFEAHEEKLGINIFERDMGWVEQSDALFSDLSIQGSIGVGREVEYAENLGIPRIIFYNEMLVPKEKVSKTLTHDKTLTLVPYNNENLEKVVEAEAKKIVS